MLGCKVQLFTVTKTGHAKEVGSTNVVKAVKTFALMQEIRAGARTWDLSG